jgi:hypothetical protein
VGTIRRVGGGLVGPALPGSPVGSRTGAEWPVKPPPIPGDLRAAQTGGLSPRTDDRTSITLPGFSTAPQGAFPVDRQADAAIAPGATSVLITIPVPQGTMLSLVGVGFDAFDPIALGFLSWSFLRSGDPDREYTNQNAVIGSIRDLSPIVFFVGNAQTFTLALTLAAASPVTYTFAARVRGWFYSETTG